MPETTAHPSQEQLSAYNLGQLPPDEAVAIESHISKCEPCCDTIISLSSDDTFVGLLKEARQLPTDQTVDHGVAASSSDQDVPVELAEHPRYEILGLIGKGGMGDVYKARHRKMERTVALKVVNRGLVRKAEAVDRFHREVKTAAQLSHPNIVTAYDADQADDFHFMVMEYVDGVDLSQTVKDRGALPVAEACDYIRQAAIGLQHAHQRGMVHRDIKPHNLMVTEDGTVKILDFGLASLAPEAIADADTVEARGDLTAAGAIMGTPDFISPEQADDARQADIRSDIYSLGSTLYFLLSGQPPFADGSVMHKLKSHAQAEPESLESLRDDVPPELVAIVTKMTAKDPDKRYLTPREVADALESFLRTWRPDETRSPRKESSGGGHGSASGGMKPGADGATPEWFPIAAKWLTYISYIPIAILMWEVFFLDGTSVASDYRFMFYIGTALCLSTIAGAISAALRFQSEMSQIERGDRRIFRLKANEGLLVLGILIGSVCAIVYYIQTNHGIVRVAVNDPSLQVTIDNQTITGKESDGEPLTIRPGKQTLIVRKGDADFEFETDRFQIRRGDEVAFKVEMLQGEIVVRKDGERFHSKALSDDIEVRQILDRMEKAYAECKSYRDSGVIKSVFFGNIGSPELTVEHSFTTAFVRPDRFRFEIKDEDNRLLISANGKDVQTWWDVEPGVKKPESLDFALAQANGFIGGDTGRIPAMLMPQELELSGDLDLIDPKQIEDGKLQNIECFRLEYNFRDEQFTLWIDKQSYLVRRIDERIKTDDVRIERTTTYDPIIDRKITDEMLEFDPPSPRAADDRAPPEARISLDQGYTILDGGKEIGSRHLVVTQDDRTLSIVEEYSLALQFDGAPLGIVERGVSAVYSLAGDTPLLMRGTNSTKEQGALVMHGTVEFENGEAEMRWTSYMDGGRKLDRPSKQQATVKPPPGTLVLGSTIQVVGPLLLPEDGDRKVVCATFNNKVRGGKPLVEYKAGCTLKRTSRPEGAGFTITLFEPDSEKPEITWEYDSKGNCESIQPTSTTVMKPHEAADSAEREQDDQTSDHKKIQGTWQVVHYAENGRVEPLPFALKMKLAFAENLLTYTMEEGREEVSSFKLDASTTPKSIDLTNGDQVILGIYELHDDQLRICLTQGRKGARAVAFESKPDTTNNILIVAERPRSSAVSPDIAAMLASTGQSEEEFKTKLHTAISHAAGIPNAQWEKFATDPTASTAGIEGEPLSLVLLSLDPPKVSKDNPDALKDFRLLTSGVPKPTELHEAMAPCQPHGYVSVIQPDYIKSSNIEIDPATGLLHGSVAFEAPDLYAGQIDFAVELKHGRMQVVEFTLPNYGIAITRDEKGMWKRGTEPVKQDPTATDLDRFQGSPPKSSQ